MAAPRLLARRREVAVTIIATATVVIVLGFHYAGQRRAGRLDTAIDIRLEHRLSSQLRFLHRLVALADPASVAIICVALVAVFLLTGRRRAALLAALGPAVAAGFAEFVLKPVIDRRLGDGLSFPSGHTTAAVSIAVVLIVALLGPSRPPWPGGARLAASAVALLGAIAVATALVGSGYHYATDTLGGFCVAVGVVLSVAWAIDAVSGWLVRSEHEPTRPPRTHEPV